MIEEINVGDMVFITMAGHDFLSRNRKELKIPVSGRFAKVTEVYDWGTPLGKQVLSDRKKVLAWGTKVSEDYKYVLSIYYPELEAQSHKGICVPELFPKYHPNTPEKGTLLLFEKLSPVFVKDMFEGANKYSVKITRKG